MWKKPENIHVLHSASLLELEAELIKQEHELKLPTKPVSGQRRQRIKTRDASLSNKGVERRAQKDEKAHISQSVKDWSAIQSSLEQKAKLYEQLKQDYRKFFVFHNSARNLDITM
jgi:hypothetical protein